MGTIGSVRAVIVWFTIRNRWYGARNATILLEKELILVLSKDTKSYKNEHRKNRKSNKL